MRDGRSPFDLARQGRDTVALPSQRSVSAIAPDGTIAVGGEYDDSEGYFVRPTVLLSDDPTDESFNTAFIRTVEPGRRANLNPRDTAGIKATLRAAEILETEGVRLRVARLPAGDDPDSMLRRGEIAAFQQAIDRALGQT